MNEVLIAPCGMNCAVCSAYLARRYDIKTKGVKMPYCAGCRPSNRQCAWLKKRCSMLLNGEVEYCYECSEFPCNRLCHIDQRYITNFRTSFIENLEYIRDNGIGQFLAKQEEKWKCPECGGVICCHNGICYDCGLDVLKERIADGKNRYRWQDD